MIPVPDPGQILRTFGGQIVCRVEVDTGISGEAGGLWGIDQWNETQWGSADASWFDMSGYVFSVDLDGGAERWGERFEARTARIEVDNTSGIFTPGLDVETPWLIPFRPGRMIRVVAVPDPSSGVKVPLFTGYIDSSPTVFSPDGHEIRAIISCTDFQARWSAHNPPALETPTGVQSTHDRVEAALDRMSWPGALRDIQTGSHELQSSFLAQSTLEECARAAAAEGGAFFCGPDGSAVFRARDWLITDARSIEIQGFIGYDEIPDGEQAAHITSIRPSWELARILNQIELARSGSSVQVVEDLDSQNLYDIRSYQRMDYELNSDAEVLVLAERMLEVYKDLRMRVDEVSIMGSADPANEDLNRLIWDTQYGDLLAVRVAPPWGWEFEVQTQVMGISHRITVDDWEVTFKLDDALVNLLESS